MEAIDQRPSKPLRPPDEAVLDVTEFDDHGTSRALFKDRWIEVERAIPGEQVRALVYGKRRRWTRIEEVLRASPDRVNAPCDYFHQGCGGCQWQMVAYDSQCERKWLRASQAFADTGLNPRLSRPARLPDPWRYRITAGISLGRSAGFRRRGTQSILRAMDCLIAHPLIGDLLGQLNQWIEASEIEDYHGEVGVDVRVIDGYAAPRLHTCILPSPGSKHASIPAVMGLALKLAELESVAGVVYRHRQFPPELLFGDAFGWATIRGQSFALSAATFFQTNLSLLESLLHVFFDAARPCSTDTVLDVYGGVGIFGLLLSPHVARVAEIEIDPVAVEAARMSGRRQGLTNLDFIVGTAESLMGGLEHADIVVVDPPRVGLAPKVVDAVARLEPRTILYTSCLARSMARDAAAFAERGYTLGPVSTFDFYPQTYHLELFGALERV
jgi:23S rRNA (uracil1939-C5)-methyltransferase